MEALRLGGGGEAEGSANLTEEEFMLATNRLHQVGGWCGWVWVCMKLYIFVVLYFRSANLTEKDFMLATNHLHQVWLHA